MRALVSSRMNFLIRSNSEEVVFRMQPAKFMFSTGSIVDLEFLKWNPNSCSSVISVQFLFCPRVNTGSLLLYSVFTWQMLSLQGVYLVRKKAWKNIPLLFVYWQT